MGQKGVALLIAMIILLVLTVVGFATMNTSSLEMRISGYSRETATAFYLTEIGLERNYTNRQKLKDLYKSGIGSQEVILDPDRPQEVKTTLTYVGNSHEAGESVRQLRGYDKSMEHRLFLVESEGELKQGSKTLSSRGASVVLHQRVPARVK